MRTPILALAFALSWMDGVVYAHSALQHSQPANGAILDKAPEAIELAFDSPLRITVFKLLDEKGAEIPLSRSVDFEPAESFRAVPLAMPPGLYWVEWRGLALDGHAMQGGFGFEVTD